MHEDFPLFCDSFVSWLVTIESLRGIGLRPEKTQPRSRFRAGATLQAQNSIFSVIIKADEQNSFAHDFNRRPNPTRGPRGEGDPAAIRDGVLLEVCAVIIIPKQLPLALSGKNFNPWRRAPIKAIVVHVTQADTAASTLGWFANPIAGVSAHYLVDKDGSIYQMVPDNFTAFHAGLSWADMQALRKAQPGWDWLMAGTNTNDMTIGIEHVGQPSIPWTRAQQEASAALIQQLCAKYKIPVDENHVVRHNSVDARHTCPATSVSVPQLVSWAAAMTPAGGSNVQPVPQAS